MSFSSQQDAPGFTKLKSALTGEAVLPGDEGYEYGIDRWSGTSVKHAGYVIFPKTNEDVVKAIEFSREKGLEMAICGGGHSYSGSSSTEGGVVIHLGKYMNQARCDPEKRLLYVGGGATWEIVDKVGIEHGLATVAGNVNNTGVGGLALGGGYGWLSGRHGMTVDNIVQFTVVLASGEIVTANETEHPELFWGCRGGGCNFGVVTEFVFKAHPQGPTVFVTHLLYSIEKLEAFLKAIEDWYETAGPDEGLHWGAMRVLPGMESGKATLLVVYFYNGDAEDGRNAVKKLYDVGPIVEKAIDALPYEKLNALQNESFVNKERRYMKGLTTRYRMSAEAIQAVLAAQDEVIKEHPSLVNCGLMFDCSPKQAIISVPLEATAYAGRGSGDEGLIFQFYQSPSLDSYVREQTRSQAQLLASKTPVALRAGKGGDALGVGYSNYDADATRSDAERVFGSNYTRLRKVKKMYDPEGLWNKWYAIEPAQEASPAAT